MKYILKLMRRNSILNRIVRTFLLRLKAIVEKMIAFWLISGVTEFGIKSVSIRLYSESDDTLTSKLFYVKNWKNHILKWFVLFSKNSKNVIDAGANIGLYSLIASSANSSEKVTAFEPNPNNFKRLVKHIEVNNFQEKINAMPYAVGEVDKEVVFHLPSDNRISDVSSAIKGHSEFFSSAKHKSISVKCVSLDSFFQNRKEAIDLIKIDVELYELHVLTGLKQILQKDRPVVFCEVFNEVIKTKLNPKLKGEIPTDYSLKIAELLKSLDYHFYALTHVGIVEVLDFYFSPMSSMYLLLPVKLESRHYLDTEFDVIAKLVASRR